MSFLVIWGRVEDSHCKHTHQFQLPGELQSSTYILFFSFPPSLLSEEELKTHIANTHINFSCLVSYNPQLKPFFLSSCPSLLSEEELKIHIANIHIDFSCLVSALNVIHLLNLRKSWKFTLQTHTSVSVFRVGQSDWQGPPLVIRAQYKSSAPILCKS